MKAEKPFQIYLLIDPASGIIRYVGCSKNPKSRIRQHIKESMERQNTQKKKWIHALAQKGQHPRLDVVAQIYDKAEARVKESEVCHQHAATVYNLHDPRKGALDFHVQKRNAEKAAKKGKKS
ncbi:MAG: GIY-YIG nuclease family protein [Deltaproteobacteria bacterium]|jgi:hypothetical protein|nr:GIY-YIG nuclease family protein [Deltaproteobacteria bacterium]